MNASCRQRSKGVQGSNSRVILRPWDRPGAQWVKGITTMSLKKVFTTGVVSAALIAANVTTFAGVAQAHDWRDGGPGRGAYRSERHDWDGGPRYGYGRDYGRGHYKKDKSDKKIARGIAIGLGVLVLGSILAAEADRHEYRRGGY